MSAAERVCGARTFLPADMVEAVIALERTAGWADLSDVMRHLRCTLQEHESGDHYAIVMELDGIETGAVWTHWRAGVFPREVGVLLDCPRAAESAEPCRQFEDHPGLCSPQLHDPWDDVSHALSH